MILFISIVVELLIGIAHLINGSDRVMAFSERIRRIEEVTVSGLMVMVMMIMMMMRMWCRNPEVTPRVRPRLGEGQIRRNVYILLPRKVKPIRVIVVSLQEHSMSGPHLLNITSGLLIVLAFKVLYQKVHSVDLFLFSHRQSRDDQIQSGVESFDSMENIHLSIFVAFDDVSKVHRFGHLPEVIPRDMESDRSNEGRNDVIVDSKLEDISWLVSKEQSQLGVVSIGFVASPCFLDQIRCGILLLPPLPASLDFLQLQRQTSTDYACRKCEDGNTEEDKHTGYQLANPRDRNFIAVADCSQRYDLYEWTGNED